MVEFLSRLRSGKEEDWEEGKKGVKGQSGRMKIRRVDGYICRRTGESRGRVYGTDG